MPTAAGLYYFASEAENHLRPPVLLIHGAGGNHLFWPPQMRRLHNQRLFAVDLSGHGKSSGIGHQAIEDYAGDVLKLLKALRIRAAVLVGHSMGGAIALQVAIRHPRRILGLCLVGSGAKLRVSPALLRSTSEASMSAAAIELIISLSFASQTNPRLKDLATARMGETRPSVLHGDFLACDAFDVTGHLSQIAAPTLVLCGAQDRMTPPAYSEFLREQIKDAELEIVPKAGHMVMLEQPAQVADKITEFLSKIPYVPAK